MYQGIPKSVSFQFKNREPKLYSQVFGALAFYSELYGQFHLFGPLRAIATELLNNAFKANQKRLFFEQEGLDLQRDYEKGQKHFVEMLHSRPQAFETLATQGQKKVHFLLEPSSNFFSLKVINEAPLHAEELKTIQAILSAKQSSVYKQIKKKEGGGMGLQMIVSLVHNLGLPKETLKLKQEQGWTVFALKLPRSITPEGKQAEELSALLQRFFPTLPTSIENKHNNKQQEDKNPPVDEMAELLNAALLPENASCKQPLDLQKPQKQFSKRDSTRTSRAKPLYPAYAAPLLKTTGLFSPKLRRWAQSLAPDLDPAQLANRVNIVLLSRRLPHALTKRKIRKIQRCIGQEVCEGLRYEATGLRISHPDFLAHWATKRISPALWDFWFAENGQGEIFALTRILEILWQYTEGHPKKEMAWDLYLDFLTKNKLLQEKTACKVLKLLDTIRSGSNTKDLPRQAKYG